MWRSDKQISPVHMHKNETKPTIFFVITHWSLRHVSKFSAMDILYGDDLLASLYTRKWGKSCPNHSFTYGIRERGVSYSKISSQLIVKYHYVSLISYLFVDINTKRSIWSMEGVTCPSTRRLLVGQWPANKILTVGVFWNEHSTTDKEIKGFLNLTRKSWDSKCICYFVLHSQEGAVAGEEGVLAVVDSVDVKGEVGMVVL